MTHVTLLACGLALASTSIVGAQTPDEPARAFVSVGGGFQSRTQTMSQSGTFQMYDEPGSYTGSSEIGNGGFFDIGGGARIFGKFSAGVSYSRFSTSSSMPLTVVAPHPVFYDTNRTVTSSADGLNHTESGIHIQLLYQLFASRRYDASLFVGPSVFTLKQDGVQSVTASEVGPPYTSVNVSTTSSSTSKTGVGANAGFGINYHVTGGLAAGFYARYAGATVKMPSGSNVKVGGPQFGFTAGYRF